MSQFDAAMSCSDAARYLNLRPGTLANQRSRGVGPRYYKLGRRVVYRVADLDAWLASHAVGGDN
ncbi:MAG: helix-turn-helix domain-containing protein [Varibaculum cambriense]|nr:helix-turn-helix domain-containing protein [Varibaculum cambriense]